MLKFTKRITTIAVAMAVGLLVVGTAGATDRLTVKDTGGTIQFNVQDSGSVAIGATTPTVKLDIYDNKASDSDVSRVWNNSILRTNLRSVGIQEWNIAVGATETGKIAYSTPAGGVGVTITTGAAYDQNKFNVANYASHFRFFYTNYVGLYILPNGVGVGTTAPAAALGVKAPTSGVVVQTVSTATKNNVRVTGTYTGTDPATYNIVIDGTGTPNTFKWNKNGGAYTTGVQITGAAQTIADGLSINFQATTGFTLNNAWLINAGQIANFETSAGTSVLAVNTNGNVGIGTTTPKSKLHVVNLPGPYADNTAATGAGLTAGAFYRTSSGAVMVVY